MRAEHFVGGAEDAVEEAELLAQQLEHAAVGLVALVQEVDDDHVVLLAVAVAAADALLDALRVPGQVVVDDQRAELEVDAFGRRLGGEQDRGFVAEVLDQRGAHVHRARAGGAAGVAVLLDPALVDRGRLRPAVGAVEEHDLSRVAVGLEEGLQILLACGATR